MNKRHLLLKMEDDKMSRAPSLYEKLRAHYRGNHIDPRAQKCADILGICFVWFMSVSELYVFLKFVLPDSFKNYDPMTIYFLKVFSCFVFINSMANWCCVRFYDTTLTDTRDRPDIQKSLWDNHPLDDRKKQESNEISKYDYDSIERKECDLDYCAICQHNIPFRAHHCKICQKCILKRDHHCYLSGRCIGFYNQRYFIIMSFFTAIASISGMLFIPVYLMEHFYPESTTSDWLLPLTLWRCLEGNIQHQYGLMMVHLYAFPFLCFMTVGFFIYEIMLVWTGKTAQEFFKNERIACKGTVAENFRSVFGPFWGVNFILPGQLLFRQEGDGKHFHNVKKF